MRAGIALAPRNKQMKAPQEDAMPRQIERHDITSPEQWQALRRQDVTASIVGALFGLHPYQTPAGLWAEKTGMEMPRRDNVEMRRGRLLEGAVAQAVKEAFPRFSIVKAREYVRDPEVRLGATPDFYLIDEHRGIDRIGIMQAKTVNQWEFERSWTDRPPMWIVLQALTEMLLLDVAWGYVACLIVDGYNFELKMYEITRHPAAEERIIEAVKDFWRKVAAGAEPTIDYERDGGLIDLMHRQPYLGATADLRGDNAIIELLDRHINLTAFIKDARTELDTIDAEIKHKLGDNEIGLVEGYKLTWKLQHQSGYSVAPRDQRVLRISQQQRS
jgi:predicted phage-related endonuclease